MTLIGRPTRYVRLPTVGEIVFTRPKVLGAEQAPSQIARYGSQAKTGDALAISVEVVLVAEVAVNCAAIALARSTTSIVCLAKKDKSISCISI